MTTPLLLLSAAADCCEGHIRRRTEPRTEPTPANWLAVPPRWHLLLAMLSLLLLGCLLLACLFLVACC